MEDRLKTNGLPVIASACKVSILNVEELTEHKIDKILQRSFKGFHGG